MDLSDFVVSQFPKTEAKRNLQFSNTSSPLLYIQVMANECVNGNFKPDWKYGEWKITSKKMYNQRFRTLKDKKNRYSNYNNAAPNQRGTVSILFGAPGKL